MTMLENLREIALEGDVLGEVVVELIDRLIAAESKLAELESQKPCAYTLIFQGMNTINIETTFSSFEKASLYSQWCSEPDALVKNPDPAPKVVPLFLCAKPTEAVQPLTDEQIKHIRERAELNSNNQVDLVKFARDIELAIRSQQIDAKPKESVAQRITEQELREIARSLWSYLRGEVTPKIGALLSEDKWFDFKGRTLLDKLNEHREPEVKDNESVAVVNKGVAYVDAKFIKNGDLVNDGDKLYLRHTVTANKAEVPSWIKQADKSILDIHVGSTVLIKFNDQHIGITADDGSTIEISYMRANGRICTNSGIYSVDQIKEWAHVTSPLKDGAQ